MAAASCTLWSQSAIPGGAYSISSALPGRSRSARDRESVVDGHGACWSPTCCGEKSSSACLRSCVAVGHGDCGLFMAAREELRNSVSTVVDDGFVQAAETRSGIGGQYSMPSDLMTSTMKSDPERFSVRIEHGGRFSLKRFRHGLRSARAEDLSLLRVRHRRHCRERGCAHCGPFQKFAPIDRFFFGFSHCNFRSSRTEILFMPIDFPPEWPAYASAIEVQRVLRFQWSNAWTHQNLRAESAPGWLLAAVPPSTRFPRP